MAEGQRGRRAPVVPGDGDQREGGGAAAAGDGVSPAAKRVPRGAGKRARVLRCCLGGTVSGWIKKKKKTTVIHGPLSYRLGLNQFIFTAGSEII